MILFDDTPAEETSPPPKSSSKIVLWLAVFALGIVLVALYLTSTIIDQEIQHIESHISTLQIALSATVPTNPTEAAMEEDLFIVRRQIRAVETLHPTLVQGHLNWPSILSALGAYDPQLINLTGLTQFENRMTLDGQAGDEAMVLAYAQALEDSALFKRVVVQSIRVVTPPTATPTPTPSPTRPSDATNTAAIPIIANGLLQPAKYVEFIILVELKVSQP